MHSHWEKYSLTTLCMLREKMTDIHLTLSTDNQNMFDTIRWYHYKSVVCSKTNMVLRHKRLHKNVKRGKRNELLKISNNASPKKITPIQSLLYLQKMLSNDIKHIFNLLWHRKGRQANMTVKYIKTMYHF